jgi:hypothetical protein
MTDLSERINREFTDRPFTDREWHLQNTWCDCCGIADLGMDRPTEFEINGRIFLSGFCLECGHEINSEIVDEIEND